jgi:hypothetical protein
MKIYLGGSSLEADMVRDFAQLVERQGHVITLGWWEAVLANREAGIPDTALSHEQRKAFAQADLAAVTTADVFWLLAPNAPSTGCWVELGCALAGPGVITVVSGAWQRCIFADMADHRFDAHTDALAWLKSRFLPVTGRAEAFSALLKADGPQDSVHPDGNIVTPPLAGAIESLRASGNIAPDDEPSAGDRHEFASMDEMVAGLGKAGA